MDLNISYLYDTYGIFPFISIALLFLLLLCISSKKALAKRARETEERNKRFLEGFSNDLNDILHVPYNDPSAIDQFTVRKELASVKGVIAQKDIELRGKDAVIKEKEDELSNRNAEYKKMLEGNLSSMPFLAGMMADYLTYDIEVLANKLDWGFDQRREKKVKDIREIRRDAKCRIEAAKEAEYQLAYLLQIYPELQDIIETDYRDLLTADSLKELSENYDYTKLYLSKEEWEHMSDTEKNQLALDRYVESRNKNKWQIGRDYEESVAYNMYEKAGWNARPTGITMKLEDMGRDIIATKGSNVDIVQCKYWSREKTIHEKHIFQLFGTTICYYLEHKGEGVTVTPVFVTNIELSPTARAVAKYLRVRVVENYPMQEYPRIKCNIGKDEYGNSVKIYHLPMDQQYDSVIISPSKHEFKAITVAEAEAAGFRRAYKWHGAKN